MSVITIGLDIDGVLHPRSAGGRYFREENITPLLEVIKGHDSGRALDDKGQDAFPGTGVTTDDA